MAYSRSGLKIHRFGSCDLQLCFWTFAFLLHKLSKEPRCFLCASSVDCETKPTVAIVVNHLKEIQDILHFLNDKTEKSFAL